MTLKGLQRELQKERWDLEDVQVVARVDGISVPVASIKLNEDCLIFLLDESVLNNTRPDSAL